MVSVMSFIWTELCHFLPHFQELSAECEDQCCRFERKLLSPIKMGVPAVSFITVVALWMLICPSQLFRKFVWLCASYF